MGAAFSGALKRSSPRMNSGAPSVFSRLGRDECGAPGDNCETGAASRPPYERQKRQSKPNTQGQAGREVNPAPTKNKTHVPLVPRRGTGSYDHELATI